MNTQLINEVTAKEFDPKSLYPETDTPEAKAKRDNIVALKADSGCLVGCVIAYILCRSQNPTYPPAAFCDTEYANCQAGCQGLGS